MTPAFVDHVLLAAAMMHLALGALALLALGVPARAVLGVHPALKPAKFGVSIAVFLATMAVLLPALALPAPVREAIAWVLVGTMVVEMTPIVLQALRGTTSHFNVRTPGDRALWGMMVGAVVVVTAVMGFVTVVATIRPLVVPGSIHPMSARDSFAWRAGLWLFLTSAISGFGMGGRMRHSVGGADGGPGLPVVNWSRSHGDLRVSHFFALHGLQVLPLASWAVARLDVGESLRWGLFVAAAGAYTALVVGTLAQAFAGRPVWNPRGATQNTPRAPDGPPKRVRARAA